MSRIVFVPVLLASLTLLAGPLEAQKKKREPGEGKIIRLEETVVEGRVQKPTAFFINTRQALVYKDMEVRESFVQEIPRAVEDQPF